MPEVRPLPSAGVTRPQRSYGPVRLPIGPAPHVPRSGWRTPPDRASPGNPHCLARVPFPLPRRIRTGAPAGFLPRSARPSPLPRRVGFRIATFEACSGFTMLRPTGLLSRPRRPLSQGSSLHGYPRKPPVSYSIKPATIEVKPPSTGNTRLRGALGKIACRGQEVHPIRRSILPTRRAQHPLRAARAAPFAHPTRIFRTHRASGGPGEFFGPRRPRRYHRHGGIHAAHSRTAAGWAGAAALPCSHRQISPRASRREICGGLNRLMKWRSSSQAPSDLSGADTMVLGVVSRIR
jgi:hypothetical protein